MAEDSGAFKTNPRNSAQIGHFVIGRERCDKDASRRKKRRSPAPRRHWPPIFQQTGSRR
jgi:hypothetical protein